MTLNTAVKPGTLRVASNPMKEAYANNHKPDLQDLTPTGLTFGSDPHRSDSQIVLAGTTVLPD